MKLLVTGGAGFIGSNFIRYWLTTHPEDTVVNLDALTYAGNKMNLADLDSTRHQFIKGDICDPTIVHEAMEGVEMVVHFAAETHVDRSIQNSHPFVRTNVFGTHILLEELLRRRDQIRRFHHISTDEVYGALALDSTDRFHENMKYQPRNPYSATKAASDHLALAYHRTYDLPITVSHCSNNYGRYMFPEKFIPKMIVNALRGEPIPVYGDGQYVRHWIHVSDHCRGIEATLQAGKIGEIYCFGGDVEHPNIEIAKQVLNLLQKPHDLITFVEDRKGHDRRYATSFEKAKTELDWEPRIPFQEGLQDMVDWYVQNESWWQPLLTH